MKKMKLISRPKINLKTLTVSGYGIYVINKSGWTITHTKINGGGEIAVNPPIERTCNVGHTCQNCSDDRDYGFLISINPDGGTVNLIMVCEKGNQRAETEAVEITPDPDYPGALICFNEDD